MVHDWWNYFRWWMLLQLLLNLSVGIGTHNRSQLMWNEQIICAATWSTVVRCCIRNFSLKSMEKFKFTGKRFRLLVNSVSYISKKKLVAF